MILPTAAHSTAESECTYFISKTDFIPHNADRGWLHVADVSNKDPSWISRLEWRKGKEYQENRGYNFTCTLLTYKINLETKEQTFVPNATPIGIKSRYLILCITKSPW